MQIIVIPDSFKLFIAYTIFKAVNESKPLVGSSKNNIHGYNIIYIPIFTLFFSPPDMPLIFSSPIIVF